MTKKVIRRMMGRRAKNGGRKTEETGEEGRVGWMRRKGKIKITWIVKEIRVR